MKNNSIVEISTEATILEEIKQFDYESHKLDIREIILELAQDLKDIVDQERKERLFMHIKCLMKHIKDVETFQLKISKVTPVLS